MRLKEHALPTEMPEFIGKYMDGEGTFTQSGLRTYLNDIAGQISYLNREADPSQFVQPVYYDLVVPISQVAWVAGEEPPAVKELRDELAQIENEEKNLQQEVIPYLEGQINLIPITLDAKLKECEATHNGKPKDLKECLKRVNKTYKDGLKLEERNLKAARVRLDKLEKEPPKIQKKILRLTKKMRESGKYLLTQEIQLGKRCKIGV
jgi:hypothetical protein